MHLIISRVATITSKSKNLYFPCDFFIDSWIIFKYFIEFPNIWEGGSVSKYLNVTNFNLIVVINIFYMISNFWHLLTFYGPEFGKDTWKFHVLEKNVGSADLECGSLLLSIRSSWLIRVFQNFYILTDFLPICSINHWQENIKITG